jgi:hypothetical protein
MGITLTDEQIKAIQAGKAQLDDFTQPQGDTRIRSIKEDCILIKNSMAQFGEMQMSVHLKIAESAAQTQKFVKILMWLQIIFMFAYFGGIYFICGFAGA